MDGLLMEPDELKRMAGKFRVPVGTLEKDYAVTMLLSLISRFPKISDMVFKGGTAIKKIYFPEARFSEDLDFTCLSDISKSLLSTLSKEIKGTIGIEFAEVKPESSRQKNSRRISVKYNDFNGHPNSIKIDISLRERPLRKVGNSLVLHTYQFENEEFRVPSMNLEEIMAEKMRAVIYARQPRHLYDAWFLFKKKVPLHPKLVQSKIKLYGEEFDIEELKASIMEMEKVWLVDLQPLLPTVPSFQTVSRSVMTRVSRIMKSK